jgi:hypothetical protein
MTECADVRDLLLDAEPDELRGIGSTRVAEHVRACRRCARLAKRILDETDLLAAYLDERPAPPVADILGRAGVPAGPRPSRRSRVRRRWLWAPAAAAVAALFVAIESRGPAPASGPALAAFDASPVVEPATGETVAVLPTDNPDITVLWFF